MPDDPSPVTASLFPALRFDDADAALGWLERGFGFTPHAVHRDAEGRIVHAEMRLGNGMIMFGQTRSPEPGNPWSTAEFGIYAVVDDIDAHYARTRAAGLEIVRPLADTDYGAREYSVRDPEGRLWSLGTYRP